jgi:hypothetical protein
MQGLVVDQSQSERRMLRAQYLLVLLRVGFLHLLVSLPLAALALRYGLTEAEAILDSSAWRLIQAMGGGSPGDSVATLVALAVVSAAAGAWTCLSVIHVWRWSLRILSALSLLLSLAALAGSVSAVTFAARQLDPAFTSLLLLHQVFDVGLLLDVGIALWLVSRVVETSSFRAILDPRLVRGPWSFVARFLNLPRARLSSRKSLAAFGLTVIGAFLIAAGFSYIGRGGLILSEVNRFRQFCGMAMPGCGAGSASMAWEFAIGCVIAFATIKAGGAMQSAAKALGGQDVDDALAQSGDRFVLYLRPFQVDQIVLPRPRLPLFGRLLAMRAFPIRIEDELFDVADGYLPLTAVGDPRSGGLNAGGMAHRTYLSNAEWQPYVADQIDRSDSIVMVINSSEGVHWEIVRVIASGNASKTLFLFDPAAKDPAVWEILAALCVERMSDGGVIPGGFRFRGRPLGFYLRSHEVVEIHNDNWSAVSYRSAFAYFLGDRAEQDHYRLPSSLV